MNIYLTLFTDSTADQKSDTKAAALRGVADRYGVDADTLVTREERSRTVVWLDKESTEGDSDGAKEVAEIREM